MSLIKGGSRLYGVLVDRGSSRGYLELVLDEAFTFLAWFHRCMKCLPTSVAALLNTTQAMSCHGMRTVLNRSTMSEKKHTFIRLEITPVLILHSRREIIMLCRVNNQLVLGMPLHTICEGNG